MIWRNKTNKKRLGILAALLWLLPAMVDAKGSVPGWALSGSRPERYEIGIDRTQFHSGGHSAFLRSIRKVRSSDFGTLVQVFSARKYSGKRIRYSAWVRTRLNSGSAALWMRVDSSDGTTLAFDNMESRPIVGNREWKKYSIVLDVPPGSHSIFFGVLSSDGTVWLDDISFEEVDKSVAVTGQVEPPLADEPQNLDFE